MSDAQNEIASLIYAYAERLDRGDFAGVGELFEHASYGPKQGTPLKGAAAVEKAMRQMVIVYEDGTPKTKHVITNLVIEVDEDQGQARAHSYYTVLQGVSGSVLQPILSGSYRDRFERSESGWRFSERVIALDLFGDLSRHLHSRPS